MSYSRIFQSLLQCSRRPVLGFAASSYSTPRLFPLTLLAAVNRSFAAGSSLQLEPASSFSSSFSRRLLSSSTVSARNKPENQQQQEDPSLCITLFLYDTTEDDVETTDGWEEEDEMVEPKIGDGGDGGGVVLQGLPWGESALSIAHDVLKQFNDDFKIFAFKISPRGYIYVRLDKLSNEYGCPTMEELESYSQEYKKRLDEAGERGEIPDDLALEVSSPGAERILRVPDDLDRFKDMRMRVCYIEDTELNCTEKSGVFILDSIETEQENCVWKLAEVKENRDPNSKGRPFSRKQKDWRLKVPFDKHRMIMLYLEY
ncbi:Ribosome maturation factor RimP [Corchorus olitorius]|uniref:Ribosome maturation factor RimP n=1 Tax=Corchorus olitorius TaxID=93759 RepID=A0A1R3HNR7_9ROSI|nr:Ribosome maturation factor RimP [Corchorus olitorius]